MALPISSTGNYEIVYIDRANGITYNGNWPLAKWVSGGVLQPNGLGIGAVTILSIKPGGSDERDPFLSNPSVIPDTSPGTDCWLGYWVTHESINTPSAISVGGIGVAPAVTLVSMMDRNGMVLQFVYVTDANPPAGYYQVASQIDHLDTATNTIYLVPFPPCPGQTDIYHLEISSE